MVSAAAIYIKNVQPEVLHVVSYVGYRLHCIAKLMMPTCVKNAINGFMKLIFWPLGTLGAFCATHVKTLREDISLEHQ